MSSSCVPTPTGPSRQRFQGHSQCRSRLRMTTTTTRKRWRWPSPRPSMQRFAISSPPARAEKAQRFAIEAINRAIEGITATTALHTCFGYAHIVHSRPTGYPFLEELAGVSAKQISLESAQQKVNLSVLKSLPGKHLIVGVIDLADDSPVETVDTVVRRIRNALEFVEPERLILAPDCGMKYLPHA